VTRLVASALALVSLHVASPAIQPLPKPVQAQLIRSKLWQPSCPVPLSKLRLLTVPYRGFDGRDHTGQLVVHQDAAVKLRRVLLELYAMRFPIRHMQLADTYGPAPPADGDVSGTFECRQAVPSPCTGGTASGHWSNHAYGLAIDINPRENPYVGCGMSRDRKSRPYLDRSRHRPGMVTPAVVAAFASVGWGWGGSWSGSTRDYMHFSFNGH
jgi:hypothetical protein